MKRKLATVSTVAIVAALAGLGAAVCREHKQSSPKVPAPSNTIARTAGRTGQHRSDTEGQGTPSESSQVPSRLDTEYAAGYTAFTKKDYTTAIATEDRVIQEDSTYEKAYNVKGIALLYAGKYDEGMQAIDKALHLNPEDGYARFNKALGLELYGHYDEAIQAYNRALQISRGDWWQAWCYYGIAGIYGRRGDVADTVNYLKQAIQLNPNTKKAAKTEADFDNVRNSTAFQELLR